MNPPAKPRLLVFELWGLGDLTIATPFLRAARERFSVTLLAKPIAVELQPHLWPEVEVIPFVAPWTAFRRKYHLHQWRWGEIAGVARKMARGKFDAVVSARWDPRDHAFMMFAFARRRVGIPRLGTDVVLTDRGTKPPPDSHRYENWREVGRLLGVNLPAQRDLAIKKRGGGKYVLIHTGAAQPTRMWPLERFHFIVQGLRKTGHAVELICDPPQLPWWQQHGENPKLPGRIEDFVAQLKDASIFVGNDSGPGHLAGIIGVPTFSIFGNQSPGRFGPLHPRARAIEGAPCPYKPCYDACRFPEPNCLQAISAEAAWVELCRFIEGETIQRVV